MNVPRLALNDGNSMPQLGYGVWQIPNDETETAVAHALEAGYRLIDTAAIYGNEEGVGRAIRASGLPREELFITTKLWNDRHGDAEAALDESLRRLGLDYLDLYLIHWPAPKYDNYLSAWKSLGNLKSSGKAKSVGVSNFMEKHLQVLFEETGTVPAVNQIELHPFFTQEDMRAFHARYGITTESWSPLGQGGALLDHPTIINLARKHERSPAQIVLRWHLDLGLVAIPKSATPRRIAENLAVFDFELDDEDRSAISALHTGNRLGAHPDNTDW